MSLSDKARDRLFIATTDKDVGTEIADAIDSASADVSTLQNTVTFKPGVASSGTTVATWAEVEAYITAHPGNVTLLIDGSVTGSVSVPATTDFDLQNRVIIKNALSDDGSYSINTLTIEDGGVLRNLWVIDNVNIECEPTTQPAIVQNSNILYVKNQSIIYLKPNATAAAIYAVSGFELQISQYSYVESAADPAYSVIETGFGSSTLVRASIGNGANAANPTLPALAFKGNGASLIIMHDSSTIPEAQTNFTGTITKQNVDLMLAGTTAQRPATVQTGAPYYDQTLNVPVWGANNQTSFVSWLDGDTTVLDTIATVHEPVVNPTIAVSSPGHLPTNVAYGATLGSIYTVGTTDGFRIFKIPARYVGNGATFTFIGPNRAM